MISLPDARVPALSYLILLPGMVTVLALAALLYRAMLPWHTFDMDTWFVPWLQEIEARGSIKALTEPMTVTVQGTNGYANYNPPYMYLLIIGSYAQGILGPMTIVKLIGVAGSFLCTACNFWLLRCFCSVRHALLGASLTLLLPSVALNAAAWGQCDTIYAGLAVLAVASAIRENWVLMMVALGAGLAFKLQTALIGPFVLYVFLSRRPPAWTLLLPICVYTLLLLPAWFAGRSVWDLATVYVDQANAYQMLSMNAPNPWTYIQHLHLLTYQAAVGPGIAIAVAIGLAIAALALFARLDKPALLIMAATVATAMPYLLPKMHDRYFMIADVLTFCLAAARPRTSTVMIAIGLQLGSVGAYLSQLADVRIGVYLGVLPIGIALFALTYNLTIRIRAARSRMVVDPVTSSLWMV